jgi:uncharacterized protein YigE (DUF2233 family)
MEFLLVRLAIAVLSLLAAITACAKEDVTFAQQDTAYGCQPVVHADANFTVCTYDITSDIRLFHSDQNGEPYLQFDVLARELSEQGKTLTFAMNGGMYHEDRSPVGFYRDTFGDQASVNTNDGPGNFHLKPNGVFWLTPTLAGVTESSAYLDGNVDPTYATQSGPMLVINGELHPDFNPDGTSRKRRNGVGISDDGLTIHFAISDGIVTFYEFATLFRDTLDAPNALFLDGQVSRLYAPQLSREELGANMGPIVGVVE